VRLSCGEVARVVGIKETSLIANLDRRSATFFPRTARLFPSGFNRLGIAQRNFRKQRGIFPQISLVDLRTYVLSHLQIKGTCLVGRSLLCTGLHFRKSHRYPLLRQSCKDRQKGASRVWGRAWRNWNTHRLGESAPCAGIVGSNPTACTRALCGVQKSRRTRRVFPGVRDASVAVSRDQSTAARRPARDSASPSAAASA
jgi:hypothetical protein